MDQNQLTQIQNNIDIGAKLDLWLQIFLVVVLGFYAVFAFIVFKQMKILNKTIHTPRAEQLNRVALVHLIFALALLVITLIVIIV